MHTCWFYTKHKHLHIPWCQRSQAWQHGRAWSQPRGGSSCWAHPSFRCRGGRSPVSTVHILNLRQEPIWHMWDDRRHASGVTHCTLCIGALRVARRVFYIAYLLHIPYVLVSHLRALVCTPHSSNDMSHYAHNVVATIYSPPQVKCYLCGKKPQMFGVCLAKESQQFRAPANGCHSIAISRGLRAPSTCMCTSRDAHIHVHKNIFTLTFTQTISNPTKSLVINTSILWILYAYRHAAQHRKLPDYNEPIVVQRQKLWHAYIQVYSEKAGSQRLWIGRGDVHFPRWSLPCCLALRGLIRNGHISSCYTQAQHTHTWKNFSDHHCAFVCMRILYTYGVRGGAGARSCRAPSGNLRARRKYGEGWFLSNDRSQPSPISPLLLRKGDRMARGSPRSVPLRAQPRQTNSGGVREKIGPLESDDVVQNACEEGGRLCRSVRRQLTMSPGMVPSRYAGREKRGMQFTPLPWSEPAL